MFRAGGGGGGGGGGVGRGSSTLRRLTRPFLGFDLPTLELLTNSAQHAQLDLVYIRLSKNLPSARLFLNAIVGDLAEDAVNLGAQLAICGGGGLISGGVLLPNLLPLRSRRRGPPLLPLLSPLLLLLLRKDATAAPLVDMSVVARVAVDIPVAAAGRVGLRARGEAVVEVGDDSVEEVDA